MSTIRDCQRALKLAIIAKMKEHKDVLFGAFSDTLTKEHKQLAWAQVTRHATKLGLKPRSREAGNPNYMRDIWWPNTRKCTMVKIKAKKAGKGLAVARKWCKLDDEVLALTGQQHLSLVRQKHHTMVEKKHSAMVDQQHYTINQKFPEVYNSPVVKIEDDDSSEEESSRYDGNRLEQSNATVPAEHSDPLVNDSDHEKAATQVQKEVNHTLKQYTKEHVKKNVPKVNREKDIKRSKVSVKAKVQLEMELLRVQIYKARLEARQLEVFMSMPRSGYTKGIGRSRNIDDNYSDESFN